MSSCCRTTTSRRAPSIWCCHADLRQDLESRCEVKPKQVKAVVTSYLALAAGELKKSGKFKLGGMLNMKLKKKPPVVARKGVNPFTKEPCAFKAKPASKAVRVLAMKKLEELVN